MEGILLGNIVKSISSVPELAVVGSLAELELMLGAKLVTLGLVNDNAAIKLGLLYTLIISYY